MQRPLPGTLYPNCYKRKTSAKAVPRSRILGLARLYVYLALYSFVFSLAALMACCASDSSKHEVQPVRIQKLDEAVVNRIAAGEVRS